MRERGGGFRRLGVLVDLLLVLLPLTLAAIAISRGDGIAERLRESLFDGYQRLSPRVASGDPPVRVVDVDEASLAKVGQWPWPRSRIAELSDRLAEDGAAVVAWDVLFSEAEGQSPASLLEALPDIPERTALRAALGKRGLLDGDRLADAFRRVPTVLAMALTSEAGAARIEPKWGLAILGGDPAARLHGRPRAVLPLSDLRAAAAGLGSVDYVPDGDLVVRRVPLFLRLGTGARAELVPSLGLEALRLAFKASTYQIKTSNASGQGGFGARPDMLGVRIGPETIATDGDGMLRVRFAGANSVRHVSAWKVLAGQIQKDEFKGRIVFVGATAAGLGDLRSTPIADAVPGVDVHAELVQQVLAGAHLARPDYAPGLETLVLLAAGLILAVLTRFGGPLPAALGLLLVVGAAFGASWYAFESAGLLFDPLVPALSWTATFLLLTISTFRRRESERRAVRLAFARYLAPAVVERLAADPRRLRLGGESRELSILFCDLRDFTRLSEPMAAEDVVAFLNALHTPLTACVLEEGGTIDKYLGDGLMAFWNAPLEAADHAARACRAALAMREAVPAIAAASDERAASRGLPPVPVAVGIGINTGAAFVGNMGSEQRFDYSVVGDPVNVAARLEAATKEFGIDILVSQSTAEVAPGFLFVPLGRLPIKGKRENVAVLALHGATADRTADFDTFLRLHQAALDAVARGDADFGRQIELAAGHAIGARYASFYRSLRADPGVSSRFNSA